MDRKILVLVTMIALLGTGCAAKRPVLYPNELYRAAGAEKARQEIDTCLKLAEEADTQGRLAEEVAAKTGKSALVGGATGVVVGAITGSALRGGLIGAAAGGTAALVSSAIKAPEDSPVFRRFVELCLYEKGYQVLGWQ